MPRTKLKDRTLPFYTKGEEIFNMTSHIIGGALSVIGLIILIVVAASHGNTMGIISSFIYGISLIILYTISSIYHGLSPKKEMAKKVFQILDHCSIYVLIAGSYTPFALCTFLNYNTQLGLTVFISIWTLAIVGIMLKCIDIKQYRVLAVICYMFMGWMIIFKAHLLPTLLGVPGTILLVLGGVLYTIGAIFFGLGIHHKWMHSIFHIFIILASISQFFCILFFVI